MTLGIGKHMTDAEILAQAASAWAELERTLVSRCKLPASDELEAARAGCICILVDAIRGTRSINVPEIIEELEDDRNVQQLGQMAGMLPPPRREENERWNQLLDAAINGIRE